MGIRRQTDMHKSGHIERCDHDVSYKSYVYVSNIHTQALKGYRHLQWKL